MIAIPEDANPNDPRWEVAYLHLAHGLVMAGTRAKIIARFTDLPTKKIQRLYRALRGMDPPAGPIMQGNARFFAIPGKHTSEAWSVQCAVFLACFERMGKITTVPVHRGWQLLAAFTVYQSLTEKLYHETAVKRLDINQAYALLAHCGFLAQPGAAELQRKECPVCLISYPIVTTERPDIQGCPICAINANNIRLSQQSSRPGSGTPPQTA